MALTAKKLDTTPGTAIERLTSQVVKDTPRTHEPRERLHVRILTDNMTKLRMDAAKSRVSQQDIVDRALEYYFARPGASE